MPANALSASDRTQLSMKLEGVYPANFGVVQGGNGTNLNILSETLNYDIKFEQSKQLRPDRGVADIIPVGASAMGGFAFEQQFKEYDTLIAAVAQNTWVAYGTNGVSLTNAFTLAATSSSWIASTAPTGNDAFTTLDKGQWFSVIPAAGASAAVKAYLNSRVFRVSPTTYPTSTTIALDPSTPVDTTIISAALAAGWRISSSKLVNGNVMTSYNMEVNHTDTSVIRLYTGMVPSKMELKLGTAAIVTGSFEFMGKGMTLPGSSSMGAPVASQTYTPANATKGVFDIFENGTAISVSTFVKSADITIDNSLRIQDAVGVFGAAGIGAGKQNVGAKLTLYLADTTMYLKVLNNTASSMSIPLLDGDGNGYVFYYPRIKYTSAKVATQSQEQDNMLDMDATALPDNVPGSPTFGKWLVIYRVGV